MKNSNLEKKLIGEIFNEPNILDEVRQLLNNDVFSEPKYQAIFKSICEVDNQGKPIDLSTVYSELKRSGLSDLVPVTDLSKIEHYTSANFLEHCKMLLELWMKRELSVKMNNAGAMIKKGDDIFEIISKLNADIYQIENNIQLEKDRNLYEELPKLLDEVHAKFKGEINEGLKSDSFPTLNRATGGIMSCDFVVVYGKEKSAKTTWTERLALDFAFQGVPISIFTLEMDFKSSAYKAISMEMGIEYLKLRNPRGQGMQAHEFEDLGHNIKKFRDTKIIIDDKTFDFDRIIGKMKILKRKHNIGLFVIDYLGLIEIARKFEARRLEIKHYSRRLKNLCKELNTPIIAVCQANDYEKTAESVDPLRDCDFALRCCKPYEDGIKSDTLHTGETYYYDKNDFLITVERSRHGKNKQNFVCGYDGTNFREKDLIHKDIPII